MITITASAKDKFLSILGDEEREGHGLRVTASRGVTPYAIDFGLGFVAPGEENDNDEVIDAEGFKVFIDPDSAPLLAGAVVDFVSGLSESGFKVTNVKAEGPPKPTGPLADKIQQVLESRVNPSIRSHGGMVSLADVRDDVAYLRFGGGCQGCGMVDVTLKQGVGVMLKESIPELKGVMDITDHASGENPYYTAGK